jgi:hypothetical protein
MAKDGKSAVERLKNRLYARGTVGKEVKEERAVLTPTDAEAPRAWKDAEPVTAPGTPEAPLQPLPPLAPLATEAPLSSPAFTPKEESVIEAATITSQPKRHMSFATKFFLGSILFFVGAIGVSALLFYGGINTTSPQNIDVQVVAPSLIDGGKQAEFGVIITNHNTTNLELADLVIDYPEGARSAADPTKALTHERITLGTIKSGQQVKKAVSALFYGSEGTTETITARVEYSVEGSNAVFEKKGTASFTIGSAPVSLTVDAPTTATAGDQFTMDITVRSNATTPVDNVVVEGQYPFGFSVASTQPSAGAGGTIWRLGTFAPGSSKVIHLSGSIDAADGDERIFRFLVGSNTDQTDPHVKVPFLTVPQTLTVEKPFITGTITLEGQTGSSVSVAAGSTLNGVIHWENNLSDAISGLELSLSVDGPAVDKNSIHAPNGFFQSSNSTIVWTSQGDSSLASVPPGGQGSYQFSFATLPPGAGGTLITNPTVTLNLTVKGTRQAEGGASNVASAATMKVNLASALVATAQSTRNAGPFINSGPMPPRAEQNSSYTVTWVIKNSANTVGNVVGQALLPPYISFIKGEDGITFDQTTRIVKWTLGDVKAGAGYTSVARQASFQVMLTPSTSQVGTAPQLTGALQVAGQDRFAQVQVEASAPAVTTSVSDISGMDTVAPK